MRNTGVKNLLKALGKNEDSWLSINAASWEGQDVTLVAGISEDTMAVAGSRWTIRCSKVVHFAIADVRGGGFNHITDGAHPLLRQYVDPWTTMFFRGAPKNTSSLIGDLWCAHRDECDDWIDFDAYINRSRPLELLLAEGHGKIAEGPRFLLDRYATVFAQHEVDTSVVGSRPFKWWTGQEWVELAVQPEAIHFGMSSVVAKSFEAKNAT